MAADGLLLRLPMAKKTIYLLLVSLSFTTFFFCSAFALDGGDLLMPVPSASELTTYIIHVRKPEHMLSAGREELESWHRSFLPSPLWTSGEPRLVYSYEKALSGFAAKLTAEELEAVAAKDGFLFAYPDEKLVAETTRVYKFLRIGSNESLWVSSSYGMGVIVGIIDSGINPNHVAFGDNLFPEPPEKWKGRCDLKRPRKCNKKLIGVRNFDSRGPQAEALDTTGHGTFVADIALGSNILNVSSVNGLAAGWSAGVAPGGHLSVYRATMASGLVASFDEAIRDGVDVITVSLTLPKGTLSENDIAIAALSAVENGILVSAAAGNHGPRPGSVRNVAPWLLTVGASTMDRAFIVTLQVSDETKYQGESLQNSTAIPSGPLRLAFHGTCSSPMSGVVGMAVLCKSDPDVVSPAEQAQRVLQASGAVMILMNARLNGSTIVLSDTVIPTVFVTYLDGQQLVAYVQSMRGGATVELIPRGTSLQVAPTPTIAGFSGRGPSATNGGIIKPDIVAPGVNILAASFTSKDEFGFFSGTSASAGIIAAVGAMLKKNHPDWSPAAIRSAIMTSSGYRNNEGVPITDQSGTGAGAHAYGAGHVFPERTNDPGLVYDISPKDYIRFLCGMGFTDNEVDAIARRSVHCATLGTITLEELNYPSISVVLGYGETKVTRTVRNVGPAVSTYTVELSGLDGSVVAQVDPPELNFVAKDEEKSFTVTFSIGTPASNGQSQVYEGNLIWYSTTSHHAVRSTIVVTLQ